MIEPEVNYQDYFLPLPKNEGQLTIKVLKAKGVQIEKSEIEKRRFDQGGVLVRHCQGVMNVQRLSESKLVLFCLHCGLRINFSYRKPTVMLLRQCVSVGKNILGSD